MCKTHHRLFFFLLLWFENALDERSKRFRLRCLDSVSWFERISRPASTHSTWARVFLPTWRRFVLFADLCHEVQKYFISLYAESFVWPLSSVLFLLQFFNGRCFVFLTALCFAVPLKTNKSKLFLCGLLIYVAVTPTTPQKTCYCPLLFPSHLRGISLLTATNTAFFYFTTD